MQKKAITYLKLNLANARKLAALDAVALEYQRVTQCYVDALIDSEERLRNPYGCIPEMATALSERWQRCAWQQACGFTFALNRRNQAEFKCLWCGYANHADVNAALNIAERFGDEALNALPFRQVEMLLALRFMHHL